MRRSKLEVIRRLAKLDTDRALRGLGEAQASVRRGETSLEGVRELSAASRRQRELSPGRQLAAEAISAAHRHERCLGVRDESLQGELGEARGAHSQARENVARAKLRVRAIENAMARRAERTRLEARRAESRRTDELVRGASRHGAEQ
ncbi:MAG: flagellar FliJ family protein [Myxococcota bacterium]